MATNGSDVSSTSGGRTIRIVFVCLNGSKKGDECNAFLLKAYKALKTAGMEPRWAEERYGLSLKTRVRNDLFVLPQFSGALFEHLRNLQCSIVGPGLMLSCLENGKAIPKTHQPLFSDCLAGMVVCCTNIAKPDREQIRDRILSMGGKWEASLSNECSVLITTEVGSRKYKEAAKLGTVSILMPDWVDTVWERSSTEVFKAMDDTEMLSKFKCPVFKGLVITVSQLRNDLRNQVENLITENGGTYSGAMKQAETTHLVTDSTGSEKYKTATKKWATSWHVYVVRSSWVFDSVQAGKCLEEEDYVVVPTAPAGISKRSTSAASRQHQKCSTPTNRSSTGVAPPFPFVDPNNTAMTAIMPDAANSTVMSNVTMGISVSHVSNSEMPSAAQLPDPPAQREEGQSDHGETTVAAVSDASRTIAALPDHSRSPSPAPMKRLRSANTPTTPVTAAEKKENDRTLILSSKRRRTSLNRTSRVDSAADPNDVMSQYTSAEMNDPNCSFRPNFDLADAHEHIEQEAQKKKPAPEESPTTVIERHLSAAAAATAAGTSFYSSPGSSDLNRPTLAKQLQNVLGWRTLSKRRGSNTTLVSNVSTGFDSPKTPAVPVSVAAAEAAALTAAITERPVSTPISQDTQEENVIVDWDDPNQKRERQRVGGLLKKRNEPTQTLVNDDMEEPIEEPPPKAYIFQLTSLSRSERDRCVEIIKKLGGSISEMANYDSNCTHLVAASPTRNEKLLAAMASGVWILHISYLHASDEAGRFVDEAAHEFGSPNVARAAPGTREEVNKLMKYCPHWRHKVQASGGEKAYSGWKIFLLAEKHKEDGFMRILMAGGAVVTKNSSEAKDGVITHVILDPAKKQTPITTATINRLMAAGAKCYKADVIFAYLAGDDLEDYLWKA